MPKTAKHTSERQSDISTFQTSTFDDRTDSISLLLSNGTHLSSVADETFMTNMSQPKLGRN
jgi:hypothetical protein